jgi:hypothetical protein
MQRAIATYAGPVTRLPAGKPRGHKRRPRIGDDLRGEVSQALLDAAGCAADGEGTASATPDEVDANQVLARAGRNGAAAQNLGPGDAAGEATGVALVYGGTAVPTRINKFLAKKHAGKSVPAWDERDDDRRFARVYYRADEPRFVEAQRARSLRGEAAPSEPAPESEIRPYAGAVLPKAKRPLSEAERIAKARRKRKMIAKKQRAANQAHKARQAAMRGSR